MPYYGEVPLQPPQAKQEKKPLPKVQVKKILRTAGGEVWEDPTLAEWSKGISYFSHSFHFFSILFFLCLMSRIFFI